MQLSELPSKLRPCLAIWSIGLPRNGNEHYEIAHQVLEQGPLNPHRSAFWVIARGERQSIPLPLPLPFNRANLVLSNHCLALATYRGSYGVGIRLGTLFIMSERMSRYPRAPPRTGTLRPSGLLIVVLPGWNAEANCA